jgi:ribose-phosphate pyrophosphokinase
MDQRENFIILSGNSNLKLAQEVCKFLGKPLGQAIVGKYSDRETQVQIGQSIRGQDVYVIQPTCEPANDYYMELFIMADAIKRASPHSVTAVIPYFGYARQDRKADPRTPITAKLMADLLEKSGYGRVITNDLHAQQIQGFFNIPVDHLYTKKIFLDQVKKYCNGFLNELIVVAPDAGATTRARNFARGLGVDYAVMEKERVRPGEIKQMKLIGEIEKVKGKTVIIFDDMIDTAGTLTEGANLMKEVGAKRIIAAATHPVLSGPAIPRIDASPIEIIFVTDTIPLGNKEVCKKIKVLSVAELIAEAIRRCQNHESIVGMD